MGIGNSENRGRGFGARGVKAGKAQAAKLERRPLTYAELSVPGADEAPPPTESILKQVELFWLRRKWELVMFAIAGSLYLLVGGFFRGVESTIKGAEKEIGRELRSLAEQCADPAARKRLEAAGWTVRVGSDGGCSLERPRN